MASALEDLDTSIFFQVSHLIQQLALINMNKFVIFVLVVCMAAAVVCDVAKETHTSSNKNKHHKSLFSQATNLTNVERTRLREVFDNMTAEEKAACTPESHTPEEREAWKDMADDQKITKIKANWAAKTDDKERACALHIHDVRKEHHKKEGKDHKGKGKDQKKEDHGVHH